MPKSSISEPMNAASNEPTHIRHYGIAGISVEVISDLPITDLTFEKKFLPFALTHPGQDIVSIRHHFSLPAEAETTIGKRIYHRRPWSIYETNDSLIYKGILPGDELFCYAVFNRSHSEGEIYHPSDKLYRAGNWHSLSLFPTDQIWLAHALLERQACYLHSAGMIMDDQGLVFLGHSGAGKSTTLSMLRGQGELLCDDRIIIRRWPEGFRVHGTWSHGDLPDVSPSSAPLLGLFLLEQSSTNEIIPLTNKAEVYRRFLQLVIKPALTDHWWEQTMIILEQLMLEVPVYRLKLDKSGKVADMLHEFIANNAT